jgi:hypothetical protein
MMSLAFVPIMFLTKSQSCSYDPPLKSGSRRHKEDHGACKFPAKTGGTYRDRQVSAGPFGQSFRSPAGSRNHATLLAEQLFDGASGALANKAVQMALEGNIVALRLALGRIIAPRRHRPSGFALPTLATAADAAPAMAAVAAAAADGTISAEEASAFSQVVDAFLRALEAGEIEARLQRLESVNGIAG